ncbi:LADA_0D08196g1_1 [Lachancea dasiensis]|uniref:Chromatin modification-related protein EAF7 n=1 Tax=Lachancea dasiensis TaxID=1072105 RepID=A0A1G4J723_9SACH|nr:LADA_0D08196g1_1 [Lachancea dasiensis]
MTAPWSIEDDIRLFRWITEFKPAGVHKHFHMISILERMNKQDQFPVVLLFDKLKSEGKGQFTAKEIWAKLDQHYDLKQLDDRENNAIEEESSEEAAENTEEPFCKSKFQALRRVLRKPREFHLPWDEYGELILENARGALEDNLEDDDHRSGGDEDREAQPGHRAPESIPPPERTSRRVTRSAASGQATGRVTRSQGPGGTLDAAGELTHDEDLADSEKSSGNSNDEAVESEEQEDPDVRMSEPDEGVVEIEKQSAKNTGSKPDSVSPLTTTSKPTPEPSPQEPATTSEPHGPPSHESPPSKRTRTTRSHQSDVTTETAENANPPEGASATPAARSSSRVANRRKSRK